MDVFTYPQWRAKGLSRRALKRDLASGAVRRIVKGVYAAADLPDTPETRARAVSMVRPQDTAACRETAAWLGGVDVLPPGRTIEQEPLHLAVRLDVTPPRTRECRAYQAELPDEDLVEEYGVLRTSDTRTALDLGRFAPRPQAVAAVDAFLHAERVDLAELWRRARLLNGVRNCRLLRANLAVADAGAESPAESMQRVLFIDAGLPRPQTQIAVFDRSGALIGYLDMGWRPYGVGSEFDGEKGHGLPVQRRHDEHRRNLMTVEADWIVDAADRLDLWGRPAALVARTAGLLLGRGWRPPPQVMDQIVRAAEYEARSGKRWNWMPLDRLLAA